MSSIKKNFYAFAGKPDFSTKHMLGLRPFHTYVVTSLRNVALMLSIHATQVGKKKESQVGDSNSLKKAWRNIPVQSSQLCRISSYI